MSGVQVILDKKAERPIILMEDPDDKLASRTYMTFTVDEAENLILKMVAAITEKANT